MTISPRKSTIVSAALVLVLLSCGQPIHPQLAYLGDEAGSSVAVIVDEDAALLHTAQLFPTGAEGTVTSEQVDDQIDRLLENLQSVLARAGSDRGDLVRLHFYVESDEVADAVREHLADHFPEPAAPAVSFVVSRLPVEKAQVAVDAVAVSRETPGETVVYLDAFHTEGTGARLAMVPAGGKIFLSGQTQPGEMDQSTRSVMESLHRTLEHYGAASSNVFQIKAFLHPMADADTVASIIRSFYTDGTVPPLVFVEWVDDSYLSYLSLDPSEGPVPIEIELHAYHPAAADTAYVTHHTPPWMTAPATYSRVAQVHGGDLLYISGLYGDTAGDARSQLYEMFESLGDILDETGSDFNHLVKGTYYVTDRSSSEALNEIRTEFYDPATPPTSSKMPVRSTGRHGAHLTFDMIGVIPPQDGAQQQSDHRE